VDIKASGRPRRTRRADPEKKTMTLRTLLPAGLLAVLLATGCADVVVRRVTPENDGGLDGFRYYLPRPYLALQKEMAVAGDEFVVVGEIGSNGVTIPATSLPDPLRYHFRASADGGALVPASEIGDAMLPDVLRKSAEGDGKPLTRATGGSGDEAAGPQGSTVALANGDRSIVYLPDWDEKYAIKYKAGLGKVDTGEQGLRLRHGWMLDNVSLSIDNVELGKFVFSQIDKLTDLASLVGARKQKVLEPFADTLTKSADGADLVPKRVQLRITYAILAQPGLYPLLKPCEEARYRERCCGTGTAVGASASGSPTTNSANWVFVPYPPFTVVAYNVRRSVAVELLTLTPPTRAPAPPTNSSGVVTAWVRKYVPALRAYPETALKVRLAPTPAGTYRAVITVTAGVKPDMTAADAEAKAALDVEGLTVPEGTVTAMSFVPTT